MAQAWTTGPAHLFAAPQGGGSNSPLYLGTAEKKPDINIITEYEPVMNDLAGQRLPYDRAYSGKEAIISVVLTRMNYHVMAALMTRPNPAAGFGGAAGLEPDGVNFLNDMGALMGTEGLTYPFWIWFPKAAIAAYAGMFAGYRFFSCITLGPDRIEPGTEGKKVHLLIQAQRSLAPAGMPVPAVGVPALTQTSTSAWLLYDHDMSAINSALLN